MPRVYKPDPTRKRYKKYSIEIIKKAVEEYASSRNLKLEDVAKKYGIHKSVLYRHSTRDMKQHGGQRALSDETEMLLIENINKCAEWGYRLDTLDLRYIVKMYLDKIGIIHKRFKDNFPGPDFVQSFLLRHKNEISQRVCENIKRVRAKVSPDTIKEYFIELAKSLNGVPASNILNYDETNLTDDPGRKKILIKRGCKYPERVLNHTKASVSIMMAGTADGKMLPPYVVYKATHLYDSWIQHGPEGTRNNRSTSGWFEGTTFEDWVQNMVCKRRVPLRTTCYNAFLFISCSNMDDSSKLQQMQDEMSRFEAEISGSDMVAIRPVIGAGTFGAVQQQLERAMPPPPPPPTLMQGFEASMMGARLMYPTVPPPPPPPSMMVPASVQRLRPPGPSDVFPGPMPFLRSGVPGPQLIPPPPPKPQPVILSAAPKLYKQPKDDEAKKEKHESKKRKRERQPTPPRQETEVIEPPPPAPAPPPAPVIPETVPKVKKEKKHRKVVRTAGGQVWEDVTLLDWPDDDFRMFCGDLGNDVTDELLTRTFGKYTSFQRAKVIRDKRTNKSKGFGFVSFKDPGDFIKAMKEMDGRYVGSRPIKLRKSTWKNRALDVVRKKEKEKAALLSLLMSGNKS
ncbi:unnamed protein product, partial [Brenthis ino]